MDPVSQQTHGLLRSTGDPSARLESSQGPRQRVLDRFHRFPFASEDAFQQGLAGILASAGELTENERSALVLQTRIYYFNRVTGEHLREADVAVAVPGASGNEREHDRTCVWGVPHHEGTHTDTRTLTFGELQHLIEEGKTDGIPNNKTIPDVLNDGVPSESTALPRKKPWEVASRP